MSTELNVNDLHNDDDEPIITPIIEDENSDDDTPPNNDVTDKDTADSTDSTDDDNLVPENRVVEDEDNDTPGIEQFLAGHGIIGGMITFDEGETKHFNDLTESEKFNVLNDLAKSTAPRLEEEYGLDENEIGLINFVREQNKPIEEVLEGLARTRAEQLIALSQSGSEDYSSMSDDAVTLKRLQANDPEATQEDLAEELERLKGGKFFEKNAAQYRSQFVQEQAALDAQYNAQRAAEFEQELEQDRSIIANAAQSIDNIAGWNISNDEKNEILHDLLEVNDHGDSLFMEEVFSDPNKLVKAAWLYKNAEARMDQIEAHYKKELTKEYTRGRQEALNGLSKDPIRGVRSSDDAEPTPSTQSGKTIKSVNDLHSDD